MNFDASDYEKCADEQSFKKQYLKGLQHENSYIFCIETEETEKGFPDVMILEKGKVFCNRASFCEFKISDKSGKIKFQPTQPSFYKRHPDMQITIVALNRKTMRLHIFTPCMMFEKLNGYELTEFAEVNLNKAEDLNKTCKTCKKRFTRGVCSTCTDYKEWEAK